MAADSDERKILPITEEIPALGFQVSAGTPNIFQTVFNLRYSRPDETHSTRPGATVLVVNEQDLDIIKKTLPHIVDRGTKHKGMQLSRYFLPIREEKVPLLIGNYSSLAQLIRSIRDFLAKLGPVADKPFFILGVTPHIFTDLSEKYLSTPHPEPIESSKESPGLSTLSNGQSLDPGSLLSWLDDRLDYRTPVPAELIENYAGISPDAQLVRRLIMMAAKTDAPVLILGDTGSGKEVVARAVHTFSRRARHKFIPVNCGAIPSELLEAELFGYVKGAFTGAINDREGLWQAADYGTLFLDEIGDLKKDHQVKILRALASGCFRRVGEIKEIPVQVRIIAATNRDIYTMVQNGEFREDLYYRLRSFLIPTMPLRNHPEDIPLLANKIWKSITKNPASILCKEAVEALQKHQWPGNVRELKTVLAGLYTVFGSREIRAKDVDFIFMLHGQTTTICTGIENGYNILMHRTRCLNHLKRAHETVNACLHTLAPILNGTLREVNRQLQETLGRLITELNRLCQEPLLFHREDIYKDTNELKEKLVNCLNLDAKKDQSAWQQWCTDCNFLMTSTISKLFTEIQVVVSQS